MPGVVEIAEGATGKGKKPTKNQLRRAKKAADKRTASETPSRATSVATEDIKAETPAPLPTDVVKTDDVDTNAQSLADKEEDLTIDDFGLPPDDPLYAQFKDTFARFQDGNKEDSAQDEKAKPEVFYEDDNDEIPDEEEEAGLKMSKKKRKQMNKLSVAELKAIVRKPELVEWTDTSAPDPRLLVSIKSQRNVIPVPTHWQLKREYLSSKRGIEKASFALPQFIKDTGIAEMRDAVLEKQSEQSLKSKQRERVQPKMGKLDIDYTKLYHAFFRHQTKPELTRYGEVYYEGKEHETNLRHLRPGELSDDLREALGMPPGAPPPWLISQQRFGPPPSYPALKIAGLNAPPPPGAQWGFGPGGYGKPPVDEYNNPLYGGDIFGQADLNMPEPPSGAPVEKSLWGELAPREAEDEESEAEEEEDDEAEEEEEGRAKDISGLETPSGMASTVPTEIGGAESISDFSLRKMRQGTESVDPGAPRSAYQVLPEQSIRAQGFFGGERAYDLSKAQGSAPLLGEERTRKRKAGDVEVSVDVDALARDDKLTKEELQRLHEEGRQASREGQWKGKVDQDDLSAMIAEESRKRLKQDQEFQEKRRQGKR